MSVPSLDDPVWRASTASQFPAGARLVHVEAGDPATAQRAFADGHIDGATLLIRDAVFTRPMAPGDGRHPLADPEHVANALGALGLGADLPVLAYDRRQGDLAAHAVFLLRLLGQPAWLLDGGLHMFDDPLATGSGPPPAPVPRLAVPWPDRIVDADAVAAHLAAGGVVIDARSAARYRGEEEPLDPVAGHIPGAVSAFYRNNLEANGTFRSPEALRALFAGLHADENAIVYCGSGVTACHDLLAIERAGLGQARLYVGSWSQWCRDPARARAPS